jgi:hypothetical protein
VRFTGVRRCTAAAYRARHFVELAAFDDRLVVRAIDQSARVFDEVALTDAAAGTGRRAMRGAEAGGS